MHGEHELPPIQVTKTIGKNIRNRLSTIKRRGDSKYDEGYEYVWVKIA